MEFHVKYIEVTVSYSKYRALVQTWLLLCGRCKIPAFARSDVSGMTLIWGGDDVKLDWELRDQGSRQRWSLLFVFGIEGGGAWET